MTRENTEILRDKQWVCDLPASVVQGVSEQALKRSYRRHTLQVRVCYSCEKGHVTYDAGWCHFQGALGILYFDGEEGFYCEKPGCEHNREWQLHYVRAEADMVKER